MRTRTHSHTQSFPLSNALPPTLSIIQIHTIKCVYIYICGQGLIFCLPFRQFFDLNLGKSALFDQKKHDQSWSSFLFLPFSLFCLKMAKTCCFLPFKRPKKIYTHICVCVYGSHTHTGAQVNRQTETDTEREREREREIYIYICCEVILWSKLALSGVIIWSKVGSLSGPSLFLTYFYGGFKRFLNT